MLVGIIHINSISNTDSATSDLLHQKEIIHADVRQQAVVVQEEILQVAGRIALLLFMFLAHLSTKSGWPRSLEIRENRENGQNKFPAGKYQGISKFKRNQGIIREFCKK